VAPPIVALASPETVIIEVAATFTFATSATVITLSAALITGLLWDIILVVKVGTTVNRGCPPFVTPSLSKVSFVIATAAPDPADTLTAGDACAVAEFCKVNVATRLLLAVIPADPNVRISFPSVLVHVPGELKTSVVPEVTVKLDESAVCAPVSPVIVTNELAARLELARSVTVMTLLAPDTAVLCQISATLKVGNAATTKRGFAPFGTPSSGVPGAVIGAAAKDASDAPEAAMVIV
jgi:hypothetical protein